MNSPMLISIIFLRCGHMWVVFVVSGSLPGYERCFSGFGVFPSP